MLNKQINLALEYFIAHFSTHHFALNLPLFLFIFHSLNKKYTSICLLLYDRFFFLELDLFFCLDYCPDENISQFAFDNKDCLCLCNSRFVFFLRSFMFVKLKFSLNCELLIETVEILLYFVVYLICWSKLHFHPCYLYYKLSGSVKREFSSSKQIFTLFIGWFSVKRITSRVY